VASTADAMVDHGLEIAEQGSYRPAELQKSRRVRRGRRAGRQTLDSSFASAMPPLSGFTSSCAVPIDRDPGPATRLHRTASAPAILLRWTQGLAAAEE
jgi:hypothetical protein